ncbi:MAG: hypothetical protein MJE68_33510 [Proteobacteria bacterium]|nr:hypothetical protein [Pseudomonadota bacterium]
MGPSPLPCQVRKADPPQPTAQGDHAVLGCVEVRRLGDVRQAAHTDTNCMPKPILEWSGSPDCTRFIIRDGHVEEGGPKG